jgi:hypothetical protein
MAIVRTGIVNTGFGSRYLQQLCKHWSHKFAMHFDAERGAIELPQGQVALFAAPAQLQVTLAVTRRRSRSDTSGHARTYRQICRPRSSAPIRLARH